MGVDVENVWARLTVLPSMPPRMGLFTSLSEWLNRGIDPRPQMYDMAPTWRAFKAGLLQPGNPVQYPRLTGWALDVGRARDVRIIEAPEGRFVAEPPVVVEGEFVGDHPVDRLRQRQWVKTHPAYRDARRLGGAGLRGGVGGRG